MPMADSSGGGFPQANIQYGHLHYTRETRTLWMYVGDDPKLETSWVSVFSQTPLNVARLSPNQRGSSWVEADGTVKRWTGNNVAEHRDIAIASVIRNVRPKQFRIYDATTYLNKPSLLSLYGIQRAQILFENAFFVGQPDRTTLPLQATVTALATTIATLSDDIPIISDIESYQYYTDDAFGAQQRQQIIQVHNWMLAVKPTMNLGMYAHLPQREYRPFIYTPSGLNGWQARNELVQEIIPSVRFLAPSLYTFQESYDEWIRYAVINIAEARRYAGGLPVYAFIWPRYHDSLVELNNDLLPADYWALQLNTLREIADGVIIWTSSKDAVQWSETLPWWIATKAFMAYNM